MQNPAFHVIIGWRMRNMRASALKFHAALVHILRKVCAKYLTSMWKNVQTGYETRVKLLTC